MTEQIAATCLNCRQCAAPLTVEQGQPFVTCRFCGATNFVDKARVVFHYLVRPTLNEDGARAGGFVIEHVLGDLVSKTFARRKVHPERIL